MLEEIMFQPIKNFFIENGFILDGEISNIDMLCIKNDLVIAIELKTVLNFKVLQQASLRQKSFQYVYIAIYTPRNLYSKDFINKLYLLKRLGIGLILVNEKTLDVTIHSNPFIVEPNKFKDKVSEKAIRELKNRRLKNNKGGITRKKTLTKYKEDALIVLHYLSLFEYSKGSQIKKTTGIVNATSILYNNYYGWFLNTDKGVYEITKEGENALESYKKTITTLLNLPSKTDDL